MTSVDSPLVEMVHVTSLCGEGLTNTYEKERGREREEKGLLRCWTYYNVTSTLQLI